MQINHTILSSGATLFLSIGAHVLDGGDASNAATFGHNGAQVKVVARPGKIASHSTLSVSSPSTATVPK